MQQGHVAGKVFRLYRVTVVQICRRIWGPGFTAIATREGGRYDARNECRP